MGGPEVPKIVLEPIKGHNLHFLCIIHKLEDFAFFEKFTLFFCNNFTHCKFLRKCAFFACLNILIPNLFSRVVAWGNCLSTNPQHLRLQTPLFRTNFAFFKYCMMKYKCVQMGRSTVAYLIWEDVILNGFFFILLLVPLRCSCGKTVCQKNAPC